MGECWPFWRRRVTAPPIVPLPQPVILANKPGVVAGRFASTPQGVILHGSRSGVAGHPTHAEFVSTASFAVNEPGGLGWNATVGSNEIAVHMSYGEWGWHARGCSSSYLAVEFAQATEAEAIDDGQVAAFCWFFAQARKTWPGLPAHFPTHAEVDGTAAYGGAVDGKSDVFSRGSSRTDDLRNRIRAALAAVGIS